MFINLTSKLPKKIPRGQIGGYWLMRRQTRRRMFAYSRKMGRKRTLPSSNPASNPGSFFPTPGALFFMGCLPIVGKVPLGGGQFWTPMPVEQANFPLKIAIAHDMRRRKTPLNMHTKKTFNFYLESDPGLGCSGLEPLNGLDPSPSLGFLSRRPAGKCHPPV